MNAEYSVTINESSRDLTAKEKIALRDFANAIALDAELDTQSSVLISPADYVVLDVHNEKAKGNKDYTKFVVIDTAGNKFVTGSASFFTKFREIFDTMKEDAPGEEYQIECYKKPSKNYAGKNFISCSLV